MSKIFVNASFDLKKRERKGVVFASICHVIVPYNHVMAFKAMQDQGLKTQRYMST